MEFTKKLVKLDVDERILKLREEAKTRGIPVTDDETLNFLCFTIKALKPKKILEIGTAEGLSAIAMLLISEAEITTIELNEAEYEIAQKNINDFDLKDRANCILGDAKEVILNLNEEYDFIFLDGPKAQYRVYLPQLKKLLKVGGVLFSDDVLLYGWVSGENPTPKKRQPLINKIAEYLQILTNDNDFTTSVLNVGEGVAVSVKNK